MSLTQSGVKLGTTGNQYIDAKIEWSAVGDIKTNTSKVTASLMYKRNNTGFTTKGTGSFSITIDGTKYTSSKYLTITESEWVTAITATKTVSHDSNGKKTLSISTSGSIPDTTLTSTSVSFSEALYTIPRASALDSLTGSNAYFNGAITYRYTPKSASFYTRCNISLNLNGEYIAVKTINLGKKTTSQQTATVTLSESELSTVYKKLPTATKGTLRFTLRTYSDSEYSTQIGDAVYKELTLTIPNNTDTQPTVTMTLSPVNSLPSPFSSLYIKGRTKVDANFTNGEGKYGAYTVSFKMTVEGKNYGAPYTSGYLSSAGEVTVNGTVTDSRGYSRTYTEKITVLSYVAPMIVPASGENEIVCTRCDADGNISDSGTYLKIKAKRSYSKMLSDGEQKNFCYLQYRYKENGGSYSSWTTILEKTASSDEVESDALVGTIDISKSYSVQIMAIDDMGESYLSTNTISTEKVYRHKAGSMNAYALGKYAEEENSFDVAKDWTAIFRGNVRFEGEAWVSLPLGTAVAESSVNSGRRGGTGVYYRVCAGGKHVYVAFNVSFTTSSSTVRAESHTIPNPPPYDVYALCPVGFADGSRGIATVSVSPKGRVNIYAVHKLPGATLSTGETVNWIDGYIDYWV